MNFIFSSSPSASSSTSSPSSSTHQICSSNPSVSMHCIPYTYTGIPPQLSSVLSLSLSEPLLGPSSKLSIHLSNQFCYRQIFLARSPHFLAILDTTELLHYYFFSCVDEGRRFNHRKYNEENITMRVSQRP